MKCNLLHSFHYFVRIFDSLRQIRANPDRPHGRYIKQLLFSLLSISPEHAETENMLHFYGSVIKMSFNGVSFCCGINRNQPLFKGKIHHKIGCPKIPLNQNKISGRRLLRNPLPDRSQHRHKFFLHWRYALPDFLQIRRQNNEIFNAVFYGILPLGFI